ncbi:ankyrin repeat domain-containing protein [Priestia megaterium]
MLKNCSIRLALIFFIMITLSGCGLSREEAREELAKLNIKYSPKNFIESVENNDIRALELFLKSGIDPNVNSTLGNTALLEATKEENLKMIQMLTENGADPTVKNTLGENALLYAAVSPSLNEALKIFLNDKKLDINKTIMGNSIIMIAAEEANKSAFNQILNRKPDITLKNKNGESLLHSAVRGEDKQIVKEVLALGVNPNVADSKGITPLSIAVDKGNQDIVKMLLEKQASPNVRGVDGGKLLTASMSKGYEKVSKELINAGAHTVSLLVFPKNHGSTTVEVKSPLGSAPVLFLKGDMNRSSSITFDLKRKARKLSFVYSNGHDGKTSWFDPPYNTKFKIIGDGKILLSSESFSISSPEKLFTIDVNNIKNLTISSDVNSDEMYISGISKFSNPEITLVDK